MKLSVSLPDEDVAYLDRFADERGIESRSAALHQAIRVLRASELDSAYEQAWAEWAVSSEDQLWESTAGDGIG